MFGNSGVDKKGPASPQSLDKINRRLNCTKLAQLILRKIIKIAATRCHILKI